MEKTDRKHGHVTKLIDLILKKVGTKPGKKDRLIDYLVAFLMDPDDVQQPPRGTCQFDDGHYVRCMSEADCLNVGGLWDGPDPTCPVATSVACMKEPYAQPPHRAAIFAGDQKGATTAPVVCPPSAS